jgi:acyl carrier protein
MPLMANGKIDRRALETCAGQRPPLETTFVPPRTPFEQAIADVWIDVLRVESVGALDNFFDLGGTSLSAMRATAEIREHLRVELSERAIFDHPTVKGLAQALVYAALARNVTAPDAVHPGESPES